jgi:feruloyl-CoA synthase
MMSAPPDAGAYEITDKGYVNQGEVIVRRASEVARLYQTQPDSGVVVLSEA